MTSKPQWWPWLLFITVMFIFTSRPMWTWAAATIWIPHLAVVFSITLAVMFLLGVGTGWSLGKTSLREKLTSKQITNPPNMEENIVKESQQ